MSEGIKMSGRLLIFDKASLKMVSVTSTPADDELKIVIKE